MATLLSNSNGLTPVAELKSDGSSVVKATLGETTVALGLSPAETQQVIAKLVPAPVVTPPPVETPPKPVLAPMKKGWPGGGWGPTEFGNLVSVNATCVRLENPSDTMSYTKNGQAVIYLESGPYGSNIKNNNIEQWVAGAVAKVKAHLDIWAFEPFNEPGGDWFFGEHASSIENAAWYTKLLKALNEAFVKEFGSSRPKIFASFDGGHNGDNTWGKNMLKADPNVVNYVDAFTEHCYDGSSADPAATLVHWNSVAEAHTLTNKPIAITEYGRPTINSTSDSPKSTPQQQAAAIGAMIKRAREVGWVPCVSIYGYRDGKNANGYGIYNEDDSPKPAVAVLAAA